MQAIPIPLALGRRARLALVAGLVAAAGATGALPGSAQAYTYPTAPLPPSPWKPIGLNSLSVTQGTITAVAPNSTLATRDPAIRAVHTGGVHSSARIWFRYLGKSNTDVPLGSDPRGTRRQIGLKLRHKNQCNLVYVMWHIEPVSQIQVTIKRNPGKATYEQCGSGGYKTVANIPVAAAGTGPHWLAARTRRLATGELALSVYADNGAAPAFQGNLTAAETAGLEGPIGVRSDNGHFAFQLSSQP